MKFISFFSIFLMLQTFSYAGLKIADTVGREKVVRDLAFSITSDWTVEIRNYKLSDALRSLRQGKLNLLISNYKLDVKQRKKLQVNCYRYAFDPLLFVVSSTNKINNLSKTQLKKILTGSTKTWKPIGGPAFGIHLAIVEDGQPGLMTLYKKFVKKKDIKANFFKAMNARNIGQLATIQPEFLGLCGYTSLPLAAKALSVDGIYPTLTNIRSGKYQPTLEYWIWISSNPKHKKTVEYKAAMDFINLLKSKKAIKLIENCGLISNKK